MILHPIKNTIIGHDFCYIDLFILAMNKKLLHSQPAPVSHSSQFPCQKSIHQYTYPEPTLTIPFLLALSMPGQTLLSPSLQVYPLIQKSRCPLLQPFLYSTNSGSCKASVPLSFHSLQTLLVQAKLACLLPQQAQHKTLLVHFLQGYHFRLCGTCYQKDEASLGYTSNLDNICSVNQSCFHQCTISNLEFNFP